MELSIPVPIPELPNVIPAHPWVMGYNGWLRVVKSGYLEPAKTGLWWLLEPLEDPKGQIILKLTT